MPELRRVTSGIGSFCAHLFAWLFKRDENSVGRFLGFYIAEQSGDIAAIHSAAFDLHNDFFAMDRLALRQRFVSDSARNIFSFRFIEVKQSIDATICAFAFAFSRWSRADQRQRPMLELEFVELGYRFALSKSVG